MEQQRHLLMYQFVAFKESYVSRTSLVCKNLIVHARPVNKILPVSITPQILS